MTTVTPVADAPPKVTEVVPTFVKSDPVRVTAVPPAAGPLFGLTEVMAGGLWYVNALGRVSEPFELVTVMPTVPAACAGASQVMVVELTTLRFAARDPPKVTVVSGVVVKLYPESVQDVPPETPPCSGETSVRIF